MIDSAHLDKVAKAMWDTHAFPEWDEISSEDRDLYRALARAAIDALQLTEEWTVTSGVNLHNPLGMDKQRSLRVADKWPDSFEAVSRLVSPWVRVDGGDQ